MVAIVFQTNNMGEARLRLALVDRGRADLLVHRVLSPGLAYGAARWFITRDKHQATLVACFTSQGMANLTICFVDSYGAAGWQNDQARHVWR